MKRDSFLDSTKFIIIILVIFGHAIEPHINYDDFLKSIYTLIYFIHMPLFVFLSGYFSKNKDLKHINKSVLKLLETYITIQFIWAILPSLLKQNFTLDLILEPHWVLWYLISLISWKYIAYALSFLKINKLILIPSTIILATVVGYFPSFGFTLSISRTLVFLPFFMAGYYTTETDITTLKNKNKILSTITLITLATCCYLIKDNYLITNKILWGSRAYSLIDSNPYIALLRPLFIIISFIIISRIFSLIVSNTFLSTLGKKTMQYYIYHGPCVIIMTKAISKLNITPSLINLLIGTTLIITILTLFSETKISRIILNPLSYLFNSK